MKCEQMGRLVFDNLRQQVEWWACMQWSRILREEINRRTTASVLKRMIQEPLDEIWEGKNNAHTIHCFSKQFQMTSRACFSFRMFGKRMLRMSDVIFYGLDAILVPKPTLSKYWEELKLLSHPGEKLPTDLVLCWSIRKYVFRVVKFTKSRQGVMDMIR